MRMGSFAGPSEQYGLPLSFVHPVDNDFIKARFHPILLDPRWKLTDEQREELQEEVDDVTALMKAGRDLVGGYDPNAKTTKSNPNRRTKQRKQARRR